MHNLHLVAYIADRIAVMYLGQLVPGEIPSPKNPPAGCRFRTPTSCESAPGASEEASAGLTRNAAQEARGRSRLQAVSKTRSLRRCAGLRT